MNRNNLENTSIRLSRKQRDEWKVSADRLGFESLADFIRTTVGMNVKLNIVSKEDLNQLIEKQNAILLELKRHGNNLNQLAKHANSKGEIKTLNTLLQDNREMKDYVHDALLIIDSCKFKKSKGNKEKLS